MVRRVEVLPEVQPDLLGHSSQYGVVGGANRSSAERCDAIAMTRPRATSSS